MTNNQQSLLSGMLETLFPEGDHAPAVLCADEHFNSLDHFLPGEWPQRQLDYQGFAASVAAELEDRPVLAIPPWGRIENRSAAPVALSGLRPGGSVPHRLVLLVPASLMGHRYGRSVRKELSENWQIHLVAYLSGGVPGVRSDFRIALVELRSRADDLHVMRVFDAPPRNTAGTAAVLGDFRRLLRMPGGASDYGFVLREPPAAGESLAPHLHDPAVITRRRSLGDYGESTTLGAIFEIRQSTLRREDLYRKAPRSTAAYRVLGGRDIRRDHSIAAPDADTLWTDRDDCETQVGDIVVRALYDLNAPSEGFVWARIQPEDIPTVPDSNVVILRPKAVLSAQDLNFVLRYLSSRHAMELSQDPRVSSFRRLTESTLTDLPVPLPDEPLSEALNDVESVLHRAADWAEEADAIIDSLFDDDSASLSRQRVIERSRDVRLRMTAVTNVETLSGKVRTQYPLPIAYRWRMLEAARSNGPTREAYLAVLDATEQALAFTAAVGLALAREVGQPVTAASDIANARLARRQGPSMSDWCNVLDELAGRAFSSIDAAISTTEFRDFCGSPAIKQARRALIGRRNDESHQRRVEAKNLATACEDAQSQLEIIMQALTFYLDNTLVIPTAVQWDTFKQAGEMSYRRLAGDHPIVPTQQMEVRTPAVEIGSLYLRDSNRELHLLRPYLIGRNCETCGNFSVFHVDRYLDGILQLKSMERGHVIDAESEVAEAVREVGLLPRP